jgi:Tol biopolymer transport system component
MEICIKLKPMKTILLLILPLMALLVACSVEITEVTPVSVTPTTAPVAATPLPWAERRLAGRLIFLKYEGDMRQLLVKLDLVSGALTTLFDPPDQGRLSNAAISPDGTQIVMIYAPPAPDQQRPGATGLYLMPAECASLPEGCGSQAPSLLRQNAQEWFISPIWSPDGKYIYYAHFVQRDDLSVSDYTIERMAYPDGQSEVVLENALWPSLSPDGSKLAYLSFDPANFNQMLKVADANGDNPRLLIPADTFTVIDDHFFSPDSKTIVFSAPTEFTAAEPSWLEQLLGVQTASAHSFPSDWWRVSVTGGEPERLTQISSIGLYGAFVPDGNHIAFIDLFGVYVMNPDGTEILQLLDLTATGMLQWQP